MRPYVNVGGPIALFLVGAIMYFALKTSVPGVNIDMVGLILMVAAAVWLVVGLVMFSGNRRRDTTVVERRDL